MNKKQALDERQAFGFLAEVLLSVEDRLGIDYPGIPDGELFRKKPLFQLTLRDLVHTVADYLSPSTDANETATRLVLESASVVAKQSVMISDLDLPILRAMHDGERKLTWPENVDKY